MAASTVQENLVKKINGLNAQAAELAAQFEPATLAWASAEGPEAEAIARSNLKALTDASSKVLDELEMARAAQAAFSAMQPPRGPDGVVPRERKPSTMSSSGSASASASAASASASADE